MAQRKSPVSYDGGPVGYRKPPAEHQFKKGGKKPKGSGRQAGRMDSRTIIENVLNEDVNVTENGVSRTISKRELFIRSGFEKALKSKSVNEHVALVRFFEKLAPDSVDPPVPLMVESMPYDEE